MFLENLVIDALEPQRLGRFWEAVLGSERLTDEPAGFETRLTIEGGPVLDLRWQCQMVVATGWVTLLTAVARSASWRGSVGPGSAEVAG